MTRRMMNYSTDWIIENYEIIGSIIIGLFDFRSLCEERPKILGKQYPIYTYILEGDAVDLFHSVGFQQLTTYKAWLTIVDTC